MRSDPKVAFVTDALPAIGGAEKTLFAALECFPGADIFTLIYNREAFIRSPLARRRVFASSLDRLPGAHAHHRLFLPLMPHAMERFDLSPYDIVVSFSYAVAHGARAGAARHLAYTHTPMRYAWGNLNVGGRQAGNTWLIDRYLAWFRDWDRAAARGIDEFATIANGIAAQIGRAYGRPARVIYPPVETDRFSPATSRGRYYIVLSRLVAHKRVDLIVDAFSELGLPLKIIGDGPERRKLRRRAAPNIEFLGFRPDPDVAAMLNQARGFVCATEEDFGIAIVEAQAAGCPVIALGRGGALETVIDGSTGVLFPEQTARALVEAVRGFEARASKFDPLAIAQHARRFDKPVFQQGFREFVLGRDASSDERLMPMKAFHTANAM